MSSRWHRSFSLQERFGDLRMDYATKGKNLGHLFADDDVVHVDVGGLPNPQKTFSAGIFGFFGGTLNETISGCRIPRTHDEGKRALGAWHTRNRLKEKYGIANSVDQLPGYIVLGRFTPTGTVLNGRSTARDFAKFYSDCERVASYRIVHVD